MFVTSFIIFNGFALNSLASIIADVRLPNIIIVRTSGFAAKPDSSLQAGA